MIRHTKPVLLSVCIAVSCALLSAQKKAMSFGDVMRFRSIRTQSISEDGKVVALVARPDRGEGEVLVHDLGRGREHRIARGASPTISKDGRWVMMLLELSFADSMKKGKDKPQQGLALLDLESGEIDEIEAIKSGRFSDDSRWIAIHSHSEKSEKDDKDKAERNQGTKLVLRSLADGYELTIGKVLDFSFDPKSRYLVYAVATKLGHNGLFYRDLANGRSGGTIQSDAGGRYGQLSWNKAGDALAYVHGIEDDSGKQANGSLMLWDVGEAQAKIIADSDSAPEGWIVPTRNQLSWSKDGERLFFGYQPEGMATLVRALEAKTDKEDPGQDVDPYDSEAILAERELDVWHWNDPLISTQQKNIWDRVKRQTYQAVYHSQSGKIVQLATEDLPRVESLQHSTIALGRSDVPYRRELTWNGRFSDIYLVSLEDGSRTRVLDHHAGSVSLSPHGKFLAYYQNGHWHLRDSDSERTRNLTAELEVPFANEDHDYPSDVPGYGIAGWVEDDSAVLIYDKFDIWQFPTDGGEARNLTAGAGRKENRIFRVIDLDEERDSFRPDEQLLLSSYHDRNKGHGFYHAKVGGEGVEKLLEAGKRFRFLAKAKHADRLLYSREDYDEFPDLWVSGLRLEDSKKITNLGVQTEPFAWGESSLVEWQTEAGEHLQGVLIKPGNYEQGKRYPVLVYYYRFFSQRLHEWDPVVVNHRPCFPYYASNGYAVFLPDIRFEVGHPGSAATNCLVPAIAKIIDMGIADPKAIGLHGHSWSGYQSAFVITQTDVFAAAIAGAPVSNMTSAYSGIRWGSGMARQFQYEKTQSRIGGTLWEVPELYIENSPVFFADQINTPLLIQFGDEDGAVPWYQGIELYLALRRLDKDCVFLQYRGEPHHLQKYANKLDYSIKMREYLDHYLKGAPAPKWISEGEPYRGK